MKALSKRTKSIIGYGSILLIVAVIAVFVSRGVASGVSVRMEKVTKSTLAVRVTVSGKTEADRKASVFPALPGTIKHVYVVEGQRVKKGQALASMDTAPFDAAVDQASAAYDQAVGQLGAIDSQTPSSGERNVAQEQLDAAHDVYLDARDARRSAEHAKFGVAAAKGAEKQAYAGYLAAKSGLKRLDAAGDTGTQRSAVARSRDRAARIVAKARADRKKAVLRAPFDGLVIFEALGAPLSDGAPKACAGSAVSPAIAPFTIIAQSSVRFSADVDESDVGRIDIGTPAVVTIDGLPGAEFKANVGSIRPAPTRTDSGSTVFPVAFKLTGEKLPRIGMSGSAEISVQDVKDAISVPIDALVEADGVQKVYIVVDGKLQSREVKTGAMTDDRVQIVSGLSEGDTVAIAGKSLLKEGAPVKAGGSK